MRRGTAVCAFAIALGFAASPHAQSRLPAQIDDKAFWSLIVELSEPDGFFADENYVSNEIGLQRVLPDLERGFEPGGVYLGVGPEQNFSYVAALRPRIAFIVDIRRQNAMQHLLYKALFELADNRADFVALLFSRPRPAGLGAESTADELLADYRATPSDSALFEATLASILRVLAERHGFALSDADRVSVTKVFTAFYEEGPEIHYIFRGTNDEAHPSYLALMDMTDASGTNWSYLGSEERFVRVRDMQLKNLIVPVVGDFGGPKTLRAIGEYVREHGDTIDVFYVSNVEPILFGNDLWRPFYDSVATLPVGDDAVFIRTFFGATTRACGHLRPSIRVPFIDSIVDMLDDYRSGEIETQCALVERSRASRAGP